MRLSSGLAIVTLVLGVGTAWTGADAQGDVAAVGGAIARLPLLDLRGDHVSVRYSAGSLQRASQLQDPFELLVAEFRRWSDREGRLSLLLLSHDEWRQAGLAMPYGLPSRVHGSSVATAAWGDEHTVGLWGRLLGWDLPVVDDAPARSTADESASLVPTDLLALFEGARLLIEEAGYGGTEAWVGDVIAHTVAATVIARGFAGGLAEAERVYANLGRADAGPPPLSAYRAGLQLDEWLWFQSRFFAAARAIVSSERRGAGRSIVKLARRNGGTLGPGDLVGRYPVLRTWLRQEFAPEAGL